MNCTAMEECIWAKYSEGQDLEILQRKFARDTTDNLKMTVFWKRKPNDEIPQRSRLSFLDKLIVSH
jgi:hypothetical protein